MMLRKILQQIIVKESVVYKEEKFESKVLDLEAVTEKFSVTTYEGFILKFRGIDYDKF